MHSPDQRSETLDRDPKTGTSKIGTLQHRDLKTRTPKTGTVKKGQLFW